MIVCICNNINDAKIVEAHKAGARKAKQVFQHCGTRPNCGKCVCPMQDKLNTLTNEIGRD